MGFASASGDARGPNFRGAFLAESVLAGLSIAAGRIMDSEVGTAMVDDLETSIKSSAALLEAVRALLRIAGPADAAAVARELVHALGGSTVEASESTPSAIPLDISFGDGAVVLPTAPLGTVSRSELERHLPSFVNDANRALALVDQTRRLSEDAVIDPLTGVANRRLLGRTLGRLDGGDIVIMIDLDHFKAINDTLGHSEGDRVLRALGRTLAASLRAVDTVGRYGGEEFVVVLRGGDAEAYLTRFRADWSAQRPHPITFSGGVAPAAPNPARALEAADRAMYRAKEAGRDQWQFATESDYL